MKFSCLPWFIRKDIIESIIDDFPTYCLLSKEWLTETAKLHGRTVLNPGKPEGNLRNPPYAKYFGTIRFSRIDYIDWETIYRYKSLHTVSLGISPTDSKVECEEFVDKLLLLPYLKRICASFEFDNPHFDLPRLLASQHKIEELSISLESLNRCLNSNTLMFTNLVDLSIIYLKSTFDIKLLIKGAPKLRQLKFDSYEEDDILIDFSSHIIPSVRELNIQYFWGRRIIKLDLSKWPNLQRLESNCTIEFTDLNHFNNIGYLTVSGSSDYISSVVSAEFPKLKSLCLQIHDAPSRELMTKILKLCASITTLELDIYEEFELPENLPVGPYAVTDLYFKGSILINSKLLQWLSASFNLLKLKFKYCLLKEETQLETVPFTTLTQLEIFTHEHNNFKNYFNRTLYPHINYIVIGRACGSCSHVTENFIDFNSDESTGEPKPKNVYMSAYL